jgi:hypothetical protein
MPAVIPLLLSLLPMAQAVPSPPAISPTAAESSTPQETAAPEGPPSPVETERGLVVRLSGKMDEAKLAALRARANVEGVRPLPSIGAELWKVRDEDVQAALGVVRKSGGIEASDYSGADYRNLFVEVPDAQLSEKHLRALDTVRQEPSMKDVRAVRLRAGSLGLDPLAQGFAQAGDTFGDKSMVLSVAPGVDVVAARTRIETSGKSGLVWSGDAQGALQPDGSSGDVTLAASEDRVRGLISIGSDRYAIEPLGDGLHAIGKVDFSAFRNEAPPVNAAPDGSVPAPFVPPPAQPDELPQEGAGPQESEAESLGVATGALAQTHMPLLWFQSPLGFSALSFAQNAIPLSAPIAVPTPTLSVGVAFTPGAAKKIKDLGDYANVAIRHVNDGFGNSGITGQVSLAGIRQLGDGEGGADYPTMARRLATRGDKKWEDVFDWRDKIEADVVVLIVNDNSHCGESAGVGVGRDQAFAVVDLQCAVNGDSFPHEIGHILGARHDTDSTVDPIGYVHGYRHGTMFGTVMTEWPKDSEGARLNRWSTPERRWPGPASGVPMGDRVYYHDARLISERLPIYAQFYP